ncbi:MAG: efflux RND transporter periplasmic adaptor subunit [Pseudomonadales bacterium]|nr:efflux RND transporter periplasmic adaptor subunit [Pseudomonadales bacterium]
MRKIITFGAPVAVLGVGAAIFAILELTKPAPEKKTEAARPLSVFVQDVEEANVDLLVSTSGEVRARTEVDIVAQVAGRIAAVSPEFMEGGVVEAGKALITIEDEDYRLSLSQAKARVAGAEVGLQQALADADVARKQLQGAKGASDLALRRPQVAEAEARLAAAKADLEQANLNLERTRISLPFNGRIRSKDVDIGQYVQPGTRLGRAFATDAVEVRIPLSDSQLASLDLPIGYVAPTGNEPKVNLSAQVSGHEQHWQGRLVSLDAAVDPETRMVYGITQVDSPYAESVSQLGMPLAVGLFVNAEIVGRRIENAVIIPREALRAGNKVFLVHDGRLTIRDVTVTHSSNAEAVISSGVQAGEQVIVSSIRNPIEGMALEPMRYGFDESSIADHHMPRATGG